MHFEIKVESQYLPEESHPDLRSYCFAYVVTIRNIGPIPAQLIARHWIIEDAAGNRQEVRGLGVLGQQPFLQPGETFSYNSGTRIGSPLGSMHCMYFGITDTADFFEAPIPPFSLKADEASLGADLSAVLH